MRSYCLAVLILVAGCATAPTTSETEREIVLKYVAIDVGTVGPFTKKGKQELNILSEKDRAAAAALLEQGAIGFVVYPKAASSSPTNPADRRPGARVILLQHDRVVGDFPVPSKS